MNFSDLAVWEPKFEEGKPFTMLIPSSRGTGKTTLFKYLFREHFQGLFDFFIFFSETLDDDDCFTDLCPDSEGMCFNKFNQTKLDIVFEHQNNFRKKFNRYANILIVFDDVTSLKTNKIIDAIFSRGRHKKFSIVLAVQSATQHISTTQKTNADVFIVFRQKSTATHRTLIENVLGDHLPNHLNKAEKISFLNTLPNFNAIVVDNLNTDLPADKRIFRFKAPL